jgi:lactate permease
VAASAVVGLAGREGAVIRKTLLPFAYYVLLTGALGYAIVWYGTAGLFNVGTLLVALVAALAVWTIAAGRRLPSVA